MKITSEQCFFHNLKPGELFSNFNSEEYEKSLEADHAIGIFVRGDKRLGTSEEDENMKRSSVYRIKISKK